MTEPQKLPSFMEPSYDWPFHSYEPFTLSKDIILRRTDNPHELLIAVCSKCKERQDDQRIKLHLDGWQVAVETRLPDHEGFILCPECSKQEYTFEDLY